MSEKKRRSYCSCHELTPDYVGHPAKAGWVERLLMKILPHFDIIKKIDIPEDFGRDGRQDTVCYLRRFYLWRSKWVGLNFGDLYIHHIIRSDDDKDPHDHPWGFRGLVLKSGYTDEQWYWHPESTWVDSDGTVRPLKAFRSGPFYEVVKPLQFISREAEHIHRVLLTPGRTAWTLIWTSGYSRDWNFITENGPVFWRKYLKIEGEYGE